MDDDSKSRRLDLSLHRSTRSLTVKDLCSFLALAEELHLARAAERLGIIQTHLSKAITLMEERLGRRLFVRTKKATHLTYAGKQLLPEALEILAQLDDADAEVRRKDIDRDSYVEVLIFEETAAPRLMRILNYLRAQDPMTRFRVCFRSRRAMYWALQDLDIDVSFISCFPITNDTFPSQITPIPLWEDSVVLAMNSTHSLCQRSIVRPTEISDGERVMSSVNGLEHRVVFEAVPKQKLLNWRVITGSAEELVARVALEHGLGVLASAQAKTIKRDDVEFRPLDLGKATITTYLLCRGEVPARSGQHAGLVSRFVEQVQHLSEA